MSRRFRKLFFFKIAYFFGKCQSYLSAISLNLNVLFEGTIIYKECAKLCASRAFVHYVPYVPSCLCILRAFLFYVPYVPYVPSFFYVLYVPSFFTCLECLHFFICHTWLYFFYMPYVPSYFYVPYYMSSFFTCLHFFKRFQLLTCLMFLHLFS